MFYDHIGETLPPGDVSTKLFARTIYTNLRLSVRPPFEGPCYLLDVADGATDLEGDVVGVGPRVAVVGLEDEGHLLAPHVLARVPFPGKNMAGKNRISLQGSAGASPGTTERNRECAASDLVTRATADLKTREWRRNPT